MATAGTWCSLATRSASLSAVIALSSVNTGPPNSPACWPVTTATVFGIDQLLRLLTRPSRRAAPLLLRREHCGDLTVLPGVTLRGRDGARPRRRIGGIAGKKWRDGVKVEGVVCREAPDPGEAAEIHRNPRRRIAARGETVFS